MNGAQTRSNSNFWVSAGVFAATLIVAEAGIRVAEIPAFILPPPSAIATALWRGLSSGILLQHLWVTLGETLAGFALGSLAGFALGTLVAQYRFVERVLYPYIVAFQALPKVALAPLVVLWFGLGLQSKVIMAALIAFFPLLVNVIAGLKSADEDRVNLLRSLAASEGQIFWLLRLPGALPFIMAGLDIAIVFSLIGAIVGEFLGAQDGLGALMQSMNFSMDISGSFSVLVVLSAVGLALHFAMQALRRRLLFWDPSVRAEQDRLVSS